MVTSSNGNISRVTGPLCGEFTGPGEFPSQRPVTRSFDVFFDLRLNKRLCKQLWGWWFETPSWSLWRHFNDVPRYWPFVRIIQMSSTGFPAMTSSWPGQVDREQPVWPTIVCFTPLMVSLIRCVGGLSKCFYQGLWLADLNADVIGQSINRRGVT